MMAREESEASVPPLRGARGSKLQRALDAVRAHCDVEARRRADPVEFVHRYADPADREMVALLSSALAFGNVKALRAKIEDALVRLGPQPSVTADEPARVLTALRGWKHRMLRAEDLAGLLVGARTVQTRSGSLGEALVAEYERSESLRHALAAWVQALRDAGGGSARRSAGASHILPDPQKGSPMKRLMLLLRWMTRPADGVDLGMWALPTAALVVPLDTHIHKLSRNLGLTSRRDLSWKTAEEITSTLRRFDPVDPVKYDFSLCHLGMLQHCPSRREPSRCEGCPVKSVCIHWAKGG